MVNSIAAFDSYWMFQQRVTKIEEMDLKGVFAAALHCLIMVTRLNNKTALAEYKIKININAPYWREKKKDLEEQLNYFCSKLEMLDTRADDLGDNIPENVDEVRSRFNELKKARPIAKKDKDQEEIAIVDRSFSSQVETAEKEL